MKSTFIKALLITTLLIHFSTPLYAQSNFDVIANSDINENMVLNIQLYGEPDSTVYTKTTLTNFGEDAVNIRSSFAEQEVKNRSMNNWIELAEEYDVFIIEPNEIKEIPVSIKIPSVALPGDHFASILYIPVVEESTSKTTNLGLGVRTNITVTVSGEIFRNLSISNFSIPYFTEYGPKNIVLEMKNDGNINTPVEGYITIYNTGGKEVAQWPIVENTFLPSTTKIWENEWNSRFGFGLFKADVSIIYKDNIKPLQEEVFFWVIPWKLCLGFTILMTTLILIGKMKSKKQSVTKVNTDDIKPIETKSKLPGVENMKKD